MSMTSTASRRAYQAFATGAQTLTVAAGEPVKVHGIAFQAVTAAIYTITDGSDNTEFKYSVAANTSDCIGVCWMADAGIKVVSNKTDGSACVFHDNPGT